MFGKNFASPVEEDYLAISSSHKHLNKNAAHIPRLHRNNCKKKPQMGRVLKNGFLPSSLGANWTSRQNYFLAIILYRPIQKKNMTLKKT